MPLAVIFLGIAAKLRISYPIALVIGGALIGFIPRFHTITFDPNLILTVVLPPILYNASFWISAREFKQNWREIFSLALGLVAVTTLVVAIVLKALLPECPWPLAFAFGAIVSPPDAAAATAVLKRFPIGSKLSTILEGESLVNDASALVLYRLAITALLSGAFSFADAGVEFTKIVVGGIGIGVVTGIILQYFSRYYLGAIEGVIFSFTIPYMTFLLADWFDVSGVLAVVTNGLIGSQILISHKSSFRRLYGLNSWDIVIIMLNCFIFILIGLQINDSVEAMTYDSLFKFIIYGLIITFVMIAVRFAWVFLKHGRLYLKKISDEKERAHVRTLIVNDTIIGWSGMRGIVSMTVALSLPLTLMDDSLVFARDEVILLTFIVVFLSLIIPGLTLPYFLKWINLKVEDEKQIISETRQQLVDAGLSEIQRLLKGEKINGEEHEFLTQYIKIRNRIFEISYGTQTEIASLENMRRKVVRQQRQALLQIWRQKKISDPILHQLERELDLEEIQSTRAELP